MPWSTFEQRTGARVAASLSILLLGAGATLLASSVADGASLAADHAIPRLDPAEASPGGATTLAPGRRPGLAAPFANLSLDEQFDLAVGRAFFRDPWIAAPATTTARDGLGPLYNAHACASCHPDGGRGALESDDAPSAALLLRLGRGAGRGSGVLPDPVYGDQLQTRAIVAGGAGEAHERPVREGMVHVSYATVAGSYADGTPFSLRRPTWNVTELAYGPLAADTRVSARLAPSLRGAGLLEAIPAASILAAADPDDRNRDGISGRASTVSDGAGGTALGRFGWKGAQPSVRRQVASALHNDIGITSEVYPAPPCSDAEEACRRAPDGGDPPSGYEISPMLLDRLTTFTATLGVPARRRAADPELLAGRETFHRSGCAACHTPRFVTGPSAIAAASQQTIWPYTDLLLHDLGPELADEVGEADAAADEWRTAPLWGLGRAARDPARTGLLHDGRARSIAEAILWHGGEANAARAAFVALPRQQREALLAFLATL